MHSLELDPYIVFTLMRDLTGHDKKPSAFLVFIYLWSVARGSPQTQVSVSYQDLADAIGISKSTAQSAVYHLTERRLIKVSLKHGTSIPDYTVNPTWRRQKGTGKAP
jgi:hypothetical protein